MHFLDQSLGKRGIRNVANFELRLVLNVSWVDYILIITKYIKIWRIHFLPPHPSLDSKGSINN